MKNRPADKTFRIRNDIFLNHEMFYSDAFQSLSASAIRTLLRCLQKRKWTKMKKAGSNRKRIVYLDEGFIFPYIEAEWMGIKTTTYWKNMKTLYEVGFIDIFYQGGWYQKNVREKDYSVYKLSDRWKNYGTPEFKAVEKKKRLQPEYYVRSNIEKKKSRATSDR